MNQNEIEKKISIVENELNDLKKELLKSKSKFPEIYKTNNSYWLDNFQNFISGAEHQKIIYRNYSENERTKALDDFKYETMTRLIERIFAVFNDGWKPDYNEDIDSFKWYLYFNIKEDEIDYAAFQYCKSHKNSLCLKEKFPISDIVRELSKEGYTQSDLEWYLKY